MIARIDTMKIENLIIFQGRITIIPVNPISCGYKNEHIDFTIKSRTLELQVVCRDKCGREVIDMELKKGEKVAVVGYLENDSDMIIIADKAMSILYQDEKTP